jgi:hypothetical protein
MKTIAIALMLASASLSFAATDEDIYLQRFYQHRFEQRQDVQRMYNHRADNRIKLTPRRDR